MDWKKVLLLTGLGTLSWISTYTGLSELIQANMGDIGFTYRIAVAFAVAMLMLMIIWLLDQLFTRMAAPVRLLFVAGYLFLTLISVGFGFGFYWKFLESRSEATRSAESAVTQVQSALLTAQTRLEQLEATLIQLTTISAQKAIDEREKGNSCPASRPGDGPRRRMRDADASRFGFVGRFVKERAVSVKKDIAVLNGDLAMVVSRDKATFDPKTGTRNVFLKSLGRKLNNSVTRFNAFRTDPQLRQFRTDFADRAGKSIFDNGRGGTFSCPDPELQTALRGVVRAIDQLPELEKPEVAAVEGSEAIIEAFRRLTTSLSGIIRLKVPPTPDELRVQQQRAVQSIKNVAQQRRIMDQKSGLGERDYIPLFIALFVDFCLLLVSVSRPMQGFQWLEQKMGNAQEGPVIKILSRFKDIHTDQQIRNVFEVFRHVVFDIRGVYYAAIPINGTDPTSTSDLDPDAAVEAQLLANLFTSFENDKVYKRVVAPLFPTSFIQKKLRSQGSKFHEAEAFRLYRFERDQWQDWMLSAMMGAAKRVEARRLVEDELFKDDAPELKANPEPVSEDKAPSLDEEETEELAKQVQADIDETLFNQDYERRLAEDRRSMARNAKVHVLHAERPVAGQPPAAVEPERAAVNYHAVVMPAESAVPVPSASPSAAKLNENQGQNSPIAMESRSPQATNPAPRTSGAPQTVSLALRAKGAWQTHKTGSHKSAPTEAPVEMQPATPPPIQMAPPMPVQANNPVQHQLVRAPAPVARPAPPPQPGNPTAEAPVQVHDALPHILQARPVAPAPIGNEPGARLPAIIRNAQPVRVPAPRPSSGRIEPQFDPNRDDMIENITNWFSQGDRKKKRKWS